MIDEDAHLARFVDAKQVNRPKKDIEAPQVLGSPGEKVNSTA